MQLINQAISINLNQMASYYYFAHFILFSLTFAALFSPHQCKFLTHLLSRIFLFIFTIYYYYYYFLNFNNRRGGWKQEDNDGNYERRKIG